MFLLGQSTSISSFMSCLMNQFRRQFHPGRYDDYFAYRYVRDGYMDELPEEKKIEVRAIFEARWPRPAPTA